MEKLEHIKLNSISKDTIDYIVYINNKMFKNFLKITTYDCIHLNQLPSLYRKIHYTEYNSEQFNKVAIQVFNNFTEASKNTKIPRHISRDELIILSIFYMCYDINL